MMAADDSIDDESRALEGTNDRIIVRYGQPSACHN
jgi:hypothetical protein